MVATGEPVRRVNRDRPPPKLFLGIGVACLAANHLAVVLGDGCEPMGLVMGCFLLLMGGWELASARWFDAACAWSDRRGWRSVAFALLGLAAAVAAAEGIAWFGYGEHLTG